MQIKIFDPNHYFVNGAGKREYEVREEFNVPDDEPDTALARINVWLSSNVMDGSTIPPIAITLDDAREEISLLDLTDITDERDVKEKEIEIYREEGVACIFGTREDIIYDVALALEDWATSNKTPHNPSIICVNNSKIKYGSGLTEDVDVLLDLSSSVPEDYGFDSKHPSFADIEAAAEEIVDSLSNGTLKIFEF